MVRFARDSMLELSGSTRLSGGFAVVSVMISVGNSDVLVISVQKL